MSGSILLVEDSPDAIELTRLALNECSVGKDVVVASDGVEAMKYLFGEGPGTARGDGGLPELVLLDLRLPKVGGFEVLERIRTDPRTKYLPVVVLTVSNLKSDMAKAYDMGANSYIRKPEDFDEYGRFLKIACDYWLEVNKRP